VRETVSEEVGNRIADCLQTDNMIAQSELMAEELLKLEQLDELRKI